ncbi:hypothetical protein VAEKB19_4130030 [Vibrio aestuarianus]|nr:hypothetical protein VAEKB19_4130030 [Vibrio aestuarianus]
MGFSLAENLVYNLAPLEVRSLLSTEKTPVKCDVTYIAPLYCE